jgi:hypothetical protein
VNEESKTRLRVAITAVLTLAEELALPAKKYPNLDNPDVIGAYVEVVAGNGIGAKAVTAARSVILGATFFPTPHAIAEAAKPFQELVGERQRSEWLNSLEERIDENGVPVLVASARTLELMGGAAKPKALPDGRRASDDERLERLFEGKGRRL